MRPTSQAQAAPAAPLAAVVSQQEKHNEGGVAKIQECHGRIPKHPPGQAHGISIAEFAYGAHPPRLALADTSGLIAVTVGSAGVWALRVRINRQRCGPFPLYSYLAAALLPQSASQYKQMLAAGHRK